MQFDLKKNLLPIFALLFTILVAATGTISSYGALTASVAAMDQRLARIERLLDNRPVAEK